MSTDALTMVLADLSAESDQLDAWISALPADRWALSTPAAGWTIAHQIAHLAWTDEASLAAIEGGEAFGRMLKSAAQDPGGYVDRGAAGLAAAAPAELLEHWRAGRAQLARALASVPAGNKIGWFGPPMGAASMATARLMETWAHGHDVAEALGIEPERTARAKHVAHLGVRARDFAYQVRGETSPSEPFRVELTGPDGDPWEWGPQDAVERVTGSGYDFAMLATRRRHRDDVDVRAEGANATYWLTIVQAFAGLPGRDPRPLAELRDGSVPS